MVKMGYVWDRTVEFLDEHASAIVPIAGLAIFVPSVITGSLGGLQTAPDPWVRLLNGLLGLLGGILSLWGQLAITALALHGPLERVGRIATRRLLPALGVYLIVGVLGGLALLPIIFIIGSANLDVAAMQAGQMPAITPGVAGAISLYMLAFLILLLFVLARLAPLTATIVNERRGLGAIPQAFRLTRGLTWRLVGVLLLYAVVTIVLSMAVTGVFGGLLGLFLGNEGTINATKVVTAIASAVVSTGLTVLAVSFTAKLYLAIERARGAPELPLS
jgi:hypothetical protein